MSTPRALLLDLFLQSSTRSDRRPEDERHLSFDVSSFSQLEFTLPVNPDGNNADSIRSFGQIKEFLYFYAPYSVELTVGGLVIPAFKKIFVVSGVIPSFAVKNVSTDRAVTCNMVYA